MTRRPLRIAAVVLALIVGASLPVDARQFTAQIQRALQQLGIWPYNGSYANGEVPTWSTASNTFVAGSGGALQTDINLAEVGGALVSLGQKTSANSIPVVFASDGSIVAAVVGSLSNNAAAPAANNVGVLSAIANAAAPSWTEGRLTLLSTDLAGNLRVGGTLTVNAGTGFAADGMFGSAFPATGPGIGCRADTTTPGTVADGIQVAPWCDPVGRFVFKTTDPCSDNLLTVPVPFDVAAAQTTEIAVAVSGSYIYICAVDLVVAGANNIAIVEDDTDNCASPSAGMNGGVTAAEGWNLGSNGGTGRGNGNAWVMRTAATNRYVCVITSTTAQTSGSFKIATAP